MTFIKQFLRTEERNRPGPQERVVSPKEETETGQRGNALSHKNLRSLPSSGQFSYKSQEFLDKNWSDKPGLDPRMQGHGLALEGCCWSWKLNPRVVV